MSTPPQQAPKAPRRSARRPKDLGQYEEIESGLTSSEADVGKSQDWLGKQISPSRQKESKGRRKSQAKKFAENAKSESVMQGAAEAHAPTRSEKVIATPIKQAYAGLAFHNSPAPSALPIPSFYSQSVPSISTAESSHGRANEADLRFENSATDLRLSSVEEFQVEPTPLDFLFEIARKSKGTPRTESPAARSTNLSIHGDSPHTRSPAPREGDSLFPFELEDNAAQLDTLGSSITTPFKERIEALRPKSSPSRTPSLEEPERKAKTEALKRLLMNSQSPGGPSMSPGMPDPNNPFNARPPQARNFQHSQVHYRHRSGPSTPAPVHNEQNPFPPQELPNTNHTGAHYSNYQSGAVQKLPSSQLRNIYHPNADTGPAELSSDNDQSVELISTARRPNRTQPPKQLPAKVPLSQPIPHRFNSHSSTPTAQQMEDDVRRILKMDLRSDGQT